MPTVTPLTETIQAAAAAVRADFVRAMAQGHEVAAMAVPRAMRAAQENIAWNLAHAAAMARAPFDEMARTMRAIEAPGTLLGDYLALAGKQATEAQKAAALERLAHTLGLTRLMRHVSKGGLRPRAQQALRLISHDTGVPKQEILRRAIPGAMFEALAAFHDDRTRRDGQKWLKDQSGKKLRFKPADFYTIPDTTNGRARAHLGDLARGYLEAVLLEAACLTDSRKPAKHLTVHAREAAQLLGSPSPEQLRSEMTALDDGKRTATALFTKGIARLSPRERQVFLLADRTTREIATTLGIKEGTVWAHQARIRTKLRPIVGQKFGMRRK
jgi:DNA-binding CsgD family transcriptional regulator